MKFENTEVWGFKHALRGMRNPLESWSKSDSYECDGEDCQHAITETKPYLEHNDSKYGFCIGKNDMDLCKRLIKGGSEHRKFLRQIFVSVDITAPLYWWKEFDTYKIGTVANSTSTMHKLLSKPIPRKDENLEECFEVGDLDNNLCMISDNPLRCDLSFYLDMLEQLRQLAIRYKDEDPVLSKKYWKELVRWLPQSWLQTRTVTMNYENIYNIIRQRQYHKLNEWSGQDNENLPNFITWAKNLPYAEEMLFNVGGND